MGKVFYPTRRFRAESSCLPCRSAPTQMGRMFVPDKTTAGKIIPPAMQTRPYGLDFIGFSLSAAHMDGLDSM